MFSLGPKIADLKEKSTDSNLVEVGARTVSPTRMNIYRFSLGLTPPDDQDK